MIIEAQLGYVYVRIKVYSTRIVYFHLFGKKPVRIKETGNIFLKS